MNESLVQFLKESRFGKMLAIVMLAVAAYLSVLVVNGIKEYQYIGADVPPTTTISVSGEGEVFAVPDIAEFTFAVTAEAKEASVAQEESATKINAIMAYLKESGIEDKDIKTTGYNLYPQYDYVRALPCTQFSCPEGERVLKGFTVTQTIHVKVRATEKAGTLIAGAGERGATDVSGLTFTIDDEEALKAQARKDAIDDAQAKAKILADDLGVTLVRIVSFSENGSSPMYYAKDMALSVGGAESVPSLPMGENKISSNVSITYQIR